MTAPSVFQIFQALEFQVLPQVAAAGSAVTLDKGMRPCRTVGSFAHALRTLRARFLTSLSGLQKATAQVFFDLAYLGALGLARGAA